MDVYSPKKELVMIGFETSHYFEIEPFALLNLAWCTLWLSNPATDVRIIWTMFLFHFISWFHGGFCHGQICWVGGQIVSPLWSLKLAASVANGWNSSLKSDVSSPGQKGFQNTQDLSTHSNVAISGSGKFCLGLSWMIYRIIVPGWFTHEHLLCYFHLLPMSCFASSRPRQVFGSTLQVDSSVSANEATEGRVAPLSMRPGACGVLRSLLGSPEDS